MPIDLTPPDPMPILNIISMFRKSKSLFTAVSLGIFDALESGPRSLKRLATDLSVDRESLGMLLDACVMMGFLERNEDWFMNTPAANFYLTSKSPNRLNGYISYSDAVLWKMWDNMPAAIREGTHRWKQTFNADGPIFSHFFRTPEAKREFLMGMHGYGLISSPQVVNCVDLSQRAMLVDLGGATGHLALSAVKRWPQLKAVVYDLVEVLEVTKEFIAEEPRVASYAGDFFHDPFPEADVYALGRILHDWSEPKILKLLQRIYDHLPSGGMILIAEKLLQEDHSGPDWAVLQSLNMLICTEGKERSLSEYANLLTLTGFGNIRGFRNPGPLDVITAIKP